MSSRSVILASQSPQRKMLMDSLGISYRIIPAELDESAVVMSDLKQRAGELARLKAEEILKSFSEAIVIAADTYPVVNGQALEKPLNISEAMLMLKKQSGQWISVYTGVAYIDRQKNIVINEVVETKALFRTLSLTEIEYYVSRNPVTTWSAGFSPAYPAGAALIEKIEGPYSSFVYGLPIEVVIKGLQQSGVLSRD